MSVKVKTNIPPGGWEGPTLMAIEPDPHEEGITRFVIHVRHNGSASIHPELFESLKACQNCLQVNELLHRLDLEAEVHRRLQLDVSNRKAQFSDGLRRLHEMVERRVKKRTRELAVTAFSAETKHSRLASALKVIGEALRVEGEE